MHLSPSHKDKYMIMAMSTRLCLNSSLKSDLSIQGLGLGLTQNNANVLSYKASKIRHCLQIYSI